MRGQRKLLKEQYSDVTPLNGATIELLVEACFSLTDNMKQALERFVMK